MKPTFQLLAFVFVTASSLASESIDRTILPIAEPEHPPVTELDVRNTQPRRAWM